MLVVLGGAVVYLHREWLIDRAIRHQLQDITAPGFTAAPDEFKVMLCGTGSPQLSAAKAQACTLVAVNGTIFGFDVGEGATKSMAVVDAINAAYRIDIGYRTANMPEQGSAAAAQARPAEIDFPPDATDVRFYDRDGITVDAHLVDHAPVEPALGYVITYAGEKVFISGDTKLSPLNLPAMQDADLVVHEAYAGHLVRQAIPVMCELGLDEQVQVAERTTGCHADTLEPAEQAHVKHLALTHLAPYPDGFLARQLFIQGMGDRYSGQITVGRDGTVTPSDGASTEPGRRLGRCNSAGSAIWRRR
ncbi:hypothetical protein [Mycobacterium sp. C31M]